MKKLILSAVALLLVVGVTYAQHPGGMPKDCCPQGAGMMPMGQCNMSDDFGHGPMKGLLRGIDLTDKQEADLEKTQLEQEKKMLARRAEMVDLQAKMKLALIADSYKEKEVKEIAGKIAKFHEDGILNHATMVRALREMLTPDQRVQFDQNILSAKPGMGKGMGHGMGMGRGMMMRNGMGPGCGEGRSDCPKKANDKDED